MLMAVVLLPVALAAVAIFIIGDSGRDRTPEQIVASLDPYFVGPGLLIYYATGGTLSNE